MSNELTFWDHLDELRGCLWRIVASVTIASIVAFYFKEPLFDIILAPCHSDFIIYKLLGAEQFSLHLINTGLAEQMLIHIKVAMCVGVIAASPYIIYVLFGFISPALYENERKYSIRLTMAAYAMFFVGMLVNYFLIFPLTVRFLGQYQVSEDIDNMLTISSYIDTLMMLSISFGIVFEIPVLSWLLARFGLLKSSWMSRYRRHAIVAILIVSAVITPTTDIITLFIVALPIWLLYEISIGIVKMRE